jgi:hypothetical protein
VACSYQGVAVDNLRLESLLLPVVLYGVCVVVLQRRYLEAEVFSSSGGLVWREYSRASA